MTIATRRLNLIPFAPQHLLALVAGGDRFAQEFGLPAADGLTALFQSDDVSPVWLARLRPSAEQQAHVPPPPPPTFVARPQERG